MTGKLHQAMADLRAAVAAEVVKLDGLVDVLCLALVSRSNLFVIGDTGIAKTFTADRFFKRIAADYIKLLMNPLMTDGEVVGPLDMPALQEGRHRRNPAGYLPGVDFAVMDELGRAGSSITGLTLGIINEGEWRNDGVTEKARTNMIVGLANTIPTGEDPAAFWDRLIVRYVAEDQLGPEDLTAMAMLPAPDPHPAKVITLAQVEAIQSQVQAMPVTEAAVQALVTIHTELDRAGMRPSPRRWLKSIEVAKGAAWLDGAKVVEPKHVRVVANVFWQTPGQRGQVRAIVWDAAAPGLLEVQALSDALPVIADMVDRLEAVTKRAARQRLTLDIYNELTASARRWLELEPVAAGEVATVHAEVRAAIDALFIRATRSGYDVEDDAGALWRRLVAA